MSENPQRRSTDPGAHYRGPNVFGIPLDPYRILEAYPNITREGARHVVKKILRMGKKGIDERQLIAEIRCCVDRWEQMLNEEEANAQAVAAGQAFEQATGLFKDKPLSRAAKRPKFDAAAEKEAREALQAANSRGGSRATKKRKGAKRVGPLD